MDASVRACFPAFSERFEGRVRYMYLDVKGLVTIGVGLLLEPVETALGLPFRFKDGGAAASKEAIAAEWKRIKDNPSLAERGAGACAALTRLELSDEAIDALIGFRLEAMESLLKRHPEFAGFDAWPSDAQLALLSMAWAIGPAGFAAFPKLRAACAARDFATAASECEISVEGNAGVAPRNAANEALFRSAAAA